MITKISPLLISYKKGIQSLCRNHYPNHPKGCPNYGKKDGCPPNQPLISEVLNLRKGVYLIYTEFDVGKHARRMQKMHPDWSKRQVYCCLYWQPTARKIQREEETKAKEEYGLGKIVDSPEAHGVNLSLLMKNIGVELEWPPRKITRLISLGGFE